MGVVLISIWKGTLTDNDKWNPHPPFGCYEGTIGKAHLQACHCMYGGNCYYDISEVQDWAYRSAPGTTCDYGISGQQVEGDRPMPVTILRQQGLRPHPGHESIWDDPCWEAWGMNAFADGCPGELRATQDTTPESDPRELRATSDPLGGRPGDMSSGAVTHNLACDDEDGLDGCQDHNGYDGFSDWYGYPSQSTTCAEAGVRTCWAQNGSTRLLMPGLHLLACKPP